MLWAPCSVYQSAPSGPLTMPLGWLYWVTGNSVIAPAVVMRPIFPSYPSVNHKAPSGPAAMPGPAYAVGLLYELNTPAVVIRPILSDPSMNQSAPSAPTAIPCG